MNQSGSDPKTILQGEFSSQYRSIERKIVKMGRFSLVTLSVLVMGATIAGCTATGPTASPASTPSSVPSVEAFSIDQYETEQWDRVLSRFPDAVRPEAEFERLVTLEEWPVLRVACLQEQGFDVQLSASGGITGTIPDEQAEAMAIARYVCDVMYPVDPKFTDPLDSSKLTRLYNYFVDELIPCLEGEGFLISAPPSETIFIETYYGTSSWSPYNDVVSDLGDRHLSEVDAACPQLPDNLYD